MRYSERVCIACMDGGQKFDTKIPGREIKLSARSQLQNQFEKCNFGALTERLWTVNVLPSTVIIHLGHMANLLATFAD